MEAIFVLLVWIVVSWMVGVAAKSRGRSRIGWFLIAIVLSPIIAILLLLAYAPRRSEPARGFKEPAAYDDNELRKNIRRARREWPGS